MLLPEELVGLEHGVLLDLDCCVESSAEEDEVGEHWHHVVCGVLHGGVVLH